MNDLEQELKHLIIDVLKLEDLGVDDIDSHAPLFGAGLGLDSLDALEIAMAMSKRYGVQPGADEAKNREIFRSVASLASFVASQRQAGPAAAPNGAGAV